MMYRITALALLLSSACAFQVSRIAYAPPKVSTLPYLIEIRFLRCFDSHPSPLLTNDLYLLLDAKTAVRVVNGASRYHERRGDSLHLDVRARVRRR